MAKSEIVAANTRFAFKLYREIAEHDSGNNVFISPASIALALAMTYNGAAGETRRAMASVLELEGLSLEDVNRANAELVDTLAGLDPKVRLAIANSLWARQGVTFDSDFLRRNKTSYHAEIETLDFGNPRAPDTINAWVRKHTEGKIEKILDGIDEGAVLFLINAIYFKGNWSKQFDKRLTRKNDFTLPDGRRVQLSMMSQNGKYQYYEEKDFQAVSLPYGNGRLSMYIFLPAERSSLATFQRSLDSKRWTAWMSRFEELQGSIALPRFKLEYSATLNEPLKALGMAPAFDAKRADFSAMCPDTQVKIDEVKHKTFVEVNEEGTEAAAVTSVGITLTAFIPERTFNMVVDRPFFCAIRDNQSGTVLFMGAILDPR